MNSKTLEFTEISLDGKTCKKLPKRRVYFSDGYLDEYSTDDEDEGKHKDTQVLVDTKNMAWLPYLSYMAWLAGTKALAVCDYLGEHLAYFLGITTPKFQYELDQFKRMAEEEKEHKRKFDAEYAGWRSNSTKDVSTPIQTKPIANEETALTKDDPSCNTDEINHNLKSPDWERY